MTVPTLAPPTLLRFTVFGHPAPQGSKRAFYNPKLKRALLVDASSKTKPWRQQVAQVAGQAMAGRPLFTGPLMMVIVFYRPRPRSHYRADGHRLTKSAVAEPTAKPDLTKLVRAAEDALTGVVYHDDAQLTRRLEVKAFGEPERVELVIAPSLPIEERAAITPAMLQPLLDCLDGE